MDLEGVYHLSNEHLEALQHLADVLHLFQHRNKNQHRRSIWWRHFSVFRKRLETVVSDLSKLREVPTSHLARTKKKPEDDGITSRLEHSLTHWRDVLVPKWQHAFSQLAADGRFAVLGLVLISVLAQSCRLLGIIAAFEDLGQHEIEQVLEQFGEEWQPRDASTRSTEEDIGEAIVRGPDSGGVMHSTKGSPAERGTQHAFATQAQEPERVPGSAVPKRPASKILTGINNNKKQKKTKKNNAIDDLFDGFG